MNTGNQTRIICLKSDAFYALIDEIILRVTEKFNMPEGNRWIASEEAMSILKIKSRTTLQKLRDEGKIRFSQPEGKNILYDKHSLLEYIESHAQEKF